MIGSYKRSAVMILLYQQDDDDKIIFEVRSENLRHQPGDICLPGGKIEDNESAVETAVRETCEELNLDEKDFEVIGEMDYFISPYANIIYPFVAVLKNTNIDPNGSEVDHVFSVPLKYFLENEPFCYELKYGPYLEEDFPYELIKGGRNYKFSSGKLNQYFYSYENHVIWGFTALVIKKFVEIIKKQGK